MAYLDVNVRSRDTTMEKVGQQKISSELKLLDKKVITTSTFKTVSNTDKEVVLEFNNTKNSNVKFNIFNMEGKVIREVVSNGNTLTVTKDMPAGIYFIVSSADPSLQISITVP